MDENLTELFFPKSVLILYNYSKTIIDAEEKKITENQDVWPNKE